MNEPTGQARRPACFVFVNGEPSFVFNYLVLFLFSTAKDAELARSCDLEF